MKQVTQYLAEHKEGGVDGAALLEPRRAVAGAAVILRPGQINQVQLAADALPGGTAPLNLPRRRAMLAASSIESPGLNTASLEQSPNLTLTVRTAWLRLERWFRSVAATCRLAKAAWNRLSKWLVSVTGC